MKHFIDRRTLLGAGALLSAGAILPAWAQTPPTLRFAAVFLGRPFLGSAATSAFGFARVGFFLKGFGITLRFDDDLPDSIGHQELRIAARA